MNYIELYCERAEAPILINLEKVEFIAMHEHKEFQLIVFQLNDGKAVVHYKDEDNLQEAMKKIANAVLSEDK
jgi:hypothetical protein